MKRIKLLFLLLISSVFLYGQEYIPLIDSTRTWNVGWFGSHREGGITYEYFFGDTISIADTLYIEVLAKVFESVELKGYVREDTISRRVYYRYSIYEVKSTLLYDFSLKEGDTIKLKGDPISYTVLQVDSIELLNGEIRKRWILSNNDKSFDNAIWIEGIGNLTIYLLKPGASEGSTFRTIMLCCYENNELVYMNEEFNTCLLDWVNISANDTEKEECQFTLFPNPSRDYLTLDWCIESPRKAETGKIEFRNASGVLVHTMTTHIPCNQQILPLAGWKSGTYTATIHLGNHMRKSITFVVAK